MSLFKTDSAKYAAEQQERFERYSTSELVEYMHLLRDKVDRHNRRFDSLDWGNLFATRRDWFASNLLYAGYVIAFVAVVSNALSALDRLSPLELSTFIAGISWFVWMKITENLHHQRAIESEVLWTMIQERREQEKTTNE